MKTDHAGSDNALLAVLPPAVFARLRPRLTLLPLGYGDVLNRPREAIRHVYFPLSGLASLLTVIDQHAALEVGLVGREGMLGIPLALGVGHSPVLTVVQGEGMALRMAAAPFLEALGRHRQLQRAVRRYTFDLLAQVTQTAGCNRFHAVEARLARWLLMTRDRMGTDRFYLTQEMLGSMLGVLRVAVTRAAGLLRGHRLIQYSRGRIDILDARGLEAVACSCYRAMRIHPPPATRSTC